MRDRSRTKWIWIVAALAALAAIAVAGYAYRDRLGRRSPEMAMSGSAPVTAPTADQPRSDITIDARRQQLIGVRVVRVERTVLASTVRTTGVVRYDETRQVDVNVKINGWIRDLDVDFTGQPVRRGQRLFTLYSPELLATQSEFILALRNRDQAESSALMDTRDYANRLVEAARQRLTLWDLSPEEIQAIESSRQPIQVVAVTAPAAGLVAEKQAVKGMHVTAGQTLYKIADLSVVWVDADVYEQDMSAVRIGQSATITLDAFPGRNFAGRAIYIYPTVDSQTRTGKVRFQLDNPGGGLKPGMFANIELRGSESTALTIPANAVLDSGAQQTVFVAQGDGVFTPRPVRLGRRTGDIVEILDGLKEGEQVAAAATFFLDSESQLRAGLRNYEPLASAPATGPAANQVLDITFRSLTDPPKTGDNVFEVTLKNESGQPVADVDVSVQLFMPAMPTMNMPAMRNESKLTPAGGGVYRGNGQVMMAGRWEVTVNVARAGQRTGSKQFALTAR
jgi:RND family efflux transporter MFP subunit